MFGVVLILIVGLLPCFYCRMEDGQIGTQNNQLPNWQTCSLLLTKRWLLCEKAYNNFTQDYSLKFGYPLCCRKLFVDYCVDIFLDHNRCNRTRFKKQFPVLNRQLCTRDDECLPTITSDQPPLSVVKRSLIISLYIIFFLSHIILFSFLFVYFFKSFFINLIL